MDKQETTGIVSGIIDAMTHNFRRHREAEDPAKARARIQEMHDMRVEFYRTLLEQHDKKEQNNG